MSVHFNIQINIQKVVHPEERTVVRGVMGSQPNPSAKKQTTEVLHLAVTADTEQQAYEKAMRLLTANQPEETVQAMDGGGRMVRDIPQA